MKKRILIIAILLFSVYSLSNAQGAFRKGNFGINLGVGLGWGYKYHHRNIDFAFVPSANLSFQYGAIGIKDVGTISFGCLFNYQRTWDDYSAWNNYPYPGTFDYRDTFGNFTFTFRPAFHAGFLNTTKFDAYAGFDFGIRRYTFYDDYDNTIDHGIDFAPDFFIGGRYMFADHFGIFSELSVHITYFKFGFAFKF